VQKDWAYNELYGAKLWDPRCTKTLISAVQSLAEHPELSFSRVLGSRRKAVSRILHHPKTQAHDLLKGHIQATQLRCQHQDFVLVASDTTDADFSSHPATQGLGPLHDRYKYRGFLIHSALAMTPEGIPLGLLSQRSWVREEKTQFSDKALRQRAFTDKESYKWLQAQKDVEAAVPASVKLLLIQDREADVFDFLAAKRGQNTALLIRATQPRLIQTTHPDGPRTLFAAVAPAPVVATLRVAVRARPDRPAREAHLSLRMVSVAIRPPQHGRATSPDPVPVRVVRATEETPPEGVKQPLEWLLVTTLPVPDAQAAVAVVGYYAKRWVIERFHYVLKSGCRLERLQLDTFTSLEKAVSLYSIVAWRLLYLTYLAREAPDTAVAEVLSAVERDVLELATGLAITTVAEAVMAVARIAGFRPVPSAPTPGVKSLWMGFRQLNHMVVGFLLARRPPPGLKGQD